MQKELFQYLSQFISENKIDLFEKNIKNRTKYITVVLEDLYQPHNISAVLRSCDCFGIQDVHLIENSNKYEPYRNVTAGSEKWLSIYKYNKKESNTVQCLNKLKNDGYAIIATSPHHDSVTIKDLPLNKKVALVFGTELEGISDEVVAHADGFVKIPMYGFTESFNISVAAALSLYQIKQNLENSSIHWELNDFEKNEILSLWAERGIKMGKQLKEKFLKTYSSPNESGS